MFYAVLNNYQMCSFLLLKTQLELDKGWDGVNLRDNDA